MDKVKKVPEIRFEGFDDEWKSIKIKTICGFFNGVGHENNISEYGHYVIVNSKFISTEGQVKKYTTDQLMELKKDDIVFVMSDLPHGKALGKTFLVSEDDKYTLNQRIGCYRIFNNKENSPNFINMIVNRNPQYLFYDDGVNQTNLKKDEILNIDLHIPSYPEQVIISRTFKNLDEKLELEKEKHEKLTNFKKAMLEDMFPKEGEKVPKVRLDGFDDEWKNYKIGNILKYEQPASYIVNSDKYKSSGTPVLTANKAFILGYTDEENVYNKGDCIIFDDFTMDIKYVDFDFKVKSSALKILSSQSHPLYFIYILLGIQNFTSKAHRRHYIGYVQKLDVLMPSSEEQALIGSFFKNLDEKIELSEKKITKIENFKKAMLEKMFV